jgi:hypothetical protein
VCLGSTLIYNIWFVYSLFIEIHSICGTIFLTSIKIKNGQIKKKREKLRKRAKTKKLEQEKEAQNR